MLYLSRAFRTMDSMEPCMTCSIGFVRHGWRMWSVAWPTCWASEPIRFPSPQTPNLTPQDNLGKIGSEALAEYPTGEVCYQDHAMLKLIEEEEAAVLLATLFGHGALMWQDSENYEGNNFSEEEYD